MTSFYSYVRKAFIPMLLVAVYAHLSRHLVFLENKMLKLISGCRFSAVLLHFHSCRQILLSPLLMEVTYST